MTAFGNGDSGIAGSVPAMGGAFGGGASGDDGAMLAFGGDPRKLPARGGGNSFPLDKSVYRSREGFAFVGGVSLPLDEPATVLFGGPFGIVCGNGNADAGAPFQKEVPNTLLDNSACRASLFIRALRNSLG